MNVSNVSIGHYAGENANAHVVVIGALKVWFSYNTPVALYYEGEMHLGRGRKLIVSENVWSVTTGRHINAIDGGTDEAKRARVSRDEFSGILNDFSVDTYRPY